MRQILFRSAAGGSSLVSLASVALMASAALPVHAISAATIHVMNCNDSGVGSLRGSVASAHSGDSIDLATAPCRRIVLTSGQIVIPQKDMTLVGPGRSKLTLDGNHASRLFLHVGGGKLMIKSMSLTNGYFTLPPGHRYGPPRGGCIKSDSSVELNRIDIHDCLVETWPYDPDIDQGGGGVFARATLRIINSNVFSNTARDGDGGGAFALGDLVVYRSHIYNNSSTMGGGLSAARGVSLSYSTVSRNTAGLGGGGVLGDKLVVNKSTVSNNQAVEGGGTVNYGNAFIYDSTFSGNVAVWGSAIFKSRSLTTSLSISNSTITFNHEINDFTSSYGAVQALHSSINSSIIAHNRWNATWGKDFVDDFGPDDVAYVHGANNLVGGANQIELPRDTIRGDPLLAPLADNGGPTKTHALLNGSLAIDRGSNLRHRLYDQRGPGFSRVKGAAPDIGAFEH